MTPRLRGRVLRALLPLLILTAGLAGAAALVALRPEVEAAPPRERVWLVRAVTITPGRVQPVIRHFGRLEVARTVVLASAVAGRVVWVSPRLVDGARVQAGEELLRLDSFPYRQRLAELQAQERQQRARLAELAAERAALERLRTLAQRRLAVAEREFQRQQRLVARKVASPRARDEAERRLLAEREALVRLEQQLATLSERRKAQEAALAALAAAIARAERDLADTVVRVPEDGILDQVQVAQGGELAPRTPIARLYPLAALELRFSLTDAEFGRLSGDRLMDRPVTARWRLGAEEVRLEGRIARVLGRIDPRTGGIPLAAPLVRAPADQALRPGIFLEVEVPDRAYDGAVRLPRAALYGEDTVYAIEEGRLVPRQVKLLAREGATVVVRGELRAGDRILTTRLPEAGPGLRVELVAEGDA